VIIAWPHADTDWAPTLPAITDCYRGLAAAIAADCDLLIVAPHGVDIPDFSSSAHRVAVARVDTNDTWTRDYGPITVEMADGSLRLLDFKFNGWGLKFAADRDNLVTSALGKAGYFSVPVDNRLNFVLEGGSIESDGRGTLLTTSRCLASANRNGQSSLSEIERYLIDTFGLKRVLWLDHGFLQGDDTDSHIDTLARLAPDDTIVYVAPGDDPADPHHAELTLMQEQLRGFTTADAKPYRLIPLPFPDAITGADGERLPATYANYLVTPSSVLLPVYGQADNDALAAAQVAKAFPGRRVVSVDCRALIVQHGSLHCATMQTSGKILTSNRL
jgi:agmatine/peptidylarginine deiminase